MGIARYLIPLASPLQTARPRSYGWCDHHVLACCAIDGMDCVLWRRPTRWHDAPIAPRRSWNTSNDPWIATSIINHLEFGSFETLLIRLTIILLTFGPDISLNIHDPDQVARSKLSCTRVVAWFVSVVVMVNIQRFLRVKRRPAKAALNSLTGHIINQS